MEVIDRLKILCVLVLIVVFSVFFVPLGLYTPAKAQRLTPADSTEWLGWITYNGEYTGIGPGFYGGYPPPTQYYRKDIEIGLRSDGVVVWRKTKK